MKHTASVEDRTFISALEAHQITPKMFDHRSHIRMAYTYLCANDIASASQLIRKVLCELLEHHGIDPSDKYHETLTQGWLRLVQHYMAEGLVTHSADEFISANPKLLDSGLLKSHYTRDLLFSERAREQFVEPDLSDLPDVSQPPVQETE